MAQTWAEYDLDQHLRKYGADLEWQEARMQTCMLCGFEFAPEDGKALDLGNSSPIRIKGRIPSKFIVCDDCYYGAEEIETED